jgi:hypothetical protein
MNATLSEVTVEEIDVVEECSAIQGHDRQWHIRPN